jgi:DNA ligase-1
MEGFAVACDSIAATSSKIEKVERLRDYLRQLDEPDVAAATRFLAGNPLGAPDRSIAIGGRTIIAAATRVWGVDEEALRLAYRATGDLGDALARFVREPHDLGLFHETLTPAALGALLAQAAAASGPAAGAFRRAMCERILAACASAGEARYAIKILTGELRIGLRESLVLDAIALAFDAPPAAVRRAAMASADIGAVAAAARNGTLDSIDIAYGTPIGFMLASPIQFGSTYRELAEGSWLVEDKFDGIRAQAHKRGDRAQIFSRTRNDISGAFPEVTNALAGCAQDCILDGEIVAYRNEMVLPFRFLQTRLQRKNPGDDLQEAVPVRFVAFDVLAAGSEFMLDRPLADRRALLSELVAPEAHLAVAPWTTLEAGAAPETIVERFEAARARGNEGLMFKRADAPYVPGRRGKWWLKLKRELSTLDVVVVGAEWGHGKRKDVLSDYTFAVRERTGSDKLLTIGKAYSGLTDREIAELTPWFLANQTGMLTRRALAVKPEVVLEVAFDIIARSSLHESGYALRFPRIARLRPDKPVSEIDTMADVDRIYAEMLAREGVAP